MRSKYQDFNSSLCFVMALNVQRCKWLGALMIVLCFSALSDAFRPSLSYRGLVRQSIQGARTFSTKQIDPSTMFSVSDSVLPATNPPSNLPDMDLNLSPKQLAYVVLTSIFITCLLVADLIGVKLFSIPLPFSIGGIHNIEHTCGMITFPITFLLGDIINEYYGAKYAKNTVYIGLAMSIFTFIVLNLAQALPSLDAPYNVTPEAFNSIFGSAKLMYIASVSAYFVGSLTDIYLFQLIKRVTKGKLLWLRATGSTVVSQLLDSFVVSYVAFSLGKSLTGQTPATIDEIAVIAATGYGLKFSLSVLLTPVLYFLKKVLGSMGVEALPAESEVGEAVKDEGMGYWSG